MYREVAISGSGYIQLNTVYIVQWTVYLSIREEPIFVDI